MKNNWQFGRTRGAQDQRQAGARQWQWQGQRKERCFHVGGLSSISPLREGLVFSFPPPLTEGMLLRDIFLFLIFFYRDDRLKSEQKNSIRADVPKENVHECMCVRACVCCAEERGRRRQEEKEEASISFLEPSYGIIYAKQAVVARGGLQRASAFMVCTS